MAAEVGVLAHSNVGVAKSYATKWTYWLSRRQHRRDRLRVQRNSLPPNSPGNGRLLLASATARQRVPGKTSRFQARNCPLKGRFCLVWL